jgi:hypothetical protein
VYDFDALYEQAKQQLQVKQDRGDTLKHNLISSLTHLRNQGFLWQGFSWTCSVCQHENWVSLERLTPLNPCEICRRNESSPVDGRLHFRLNPFAQHAFAASSSQGSIIWCLKQLANQAELAGFRSGKRSFSFAPALDLFIERDSKPWTDIDITANINGLIYLVEVKRSFTGVNQKVLNQLYELGEKLRPDVVLLAIHSDPPQQWDMLEPLTVLESKLKLVDVKFALLRPGNQQVTFLDSIDIAQKYGKAMNWSVW